MALVHDWLTGMRGGERCLEIFCELFPKADVYTLLHVKGSVSERIERHPIRTSFIQNLPFAASQYRRYLPLFPAAIERFRLRNYDLVLSSSHCVAKGVRVIGAGRHVSYVHAPMRYVWDQFDNYFGVGRSGWISRTAMTFLRKPLQRWDVASSARVHGLIANSRNIADKIQRYYGRDAAVLHPPVNWHEFAVAPKSEDYYLIVTAFAPYKRIDVAIEACTMLGRPLKIIGKGQDEARLRRLAGPTVTFLGWQPDEVVRDHYAGCKALLFPGEEDFGIVPLEAMACGKPVIAFGKGGALETVVPLNRADSGRAPDPSGIPSRPPAQSPTGVFFFEQSAEALADAIVTFERNAGLFDPFSIRHHVAGFDRSLFKQRLLDMIMNTLAGKGSDQSC